MKKISRKLNLNRETLIPLTDDALDAINGGITPTITTSSAPCTMTTGTSSISLCQPPTHTLQSRWCK